MFQNHQKYLKSQQQTKNLNGGITVKIGDGSNVITIDPDLISTDIAQFNLLNTTYMKKRAL